MQEYYPNQQPELDEAESYLQLERSRRHLAAAIADVMELSSRSRLSRLSLAKMFSVASFQSWAYTVALSNAEHSVVADHLNTGYLEESRFRQDFINGYFVEPVCAPIHEDEFEIDCSEDDWDLEELAEEVTDMNIANMNEDLECFIEAVTGESLSDWVEP